MAVLTLLTLIPCSLEVYTKPWGLSRWLNNHSYSPNAAAGYLSVVLIVVQIAGVLSLF